MWLVGRPLSNAAADEQAIGKTVGLAVFASDALSSTAYATQEILTVLAAGGVLALSYAFPIAMAIVVLLAIVAISYRQVIEAYPGGGGAYIVARDNLGPRTAQIAAAAILTDYSLTVAVSVSSGVAQMASAFPFLLEHRVATAVVMVVAIMVMNLRGVREAGAVFAVPSYFFIAMMYTTLLYGLWQSLRGALGTVPDPPPLHAAEAHALGAFLILHAFSNGTTALTGVEAISTGTTAFKEPRSKNAGTTLLTMAAILASLFLGITFLARGVAAVPSETETVISQVARTVFDGRGAGYLLAIAATTLILLMAANTSFNGFPRLSALLASHGYLPRQLTYRGSRLVFSRGILMLATISSSLIIAFDASVTKLIPLYAIGVFLSFTFAQAGMTRRWMRVGRLAPGEEEQASASVLRPDPRWRLKMTVNAIGAVMTAIVTLIFAATKFGDGAWLVFIVIPVLVAAFRAVSGHYLELGHRLSLDDYGAPPRVRRHRVILPISGVHRGTVLALRYALALSDDITAVHVSVDAEKSRRLEERWWRWGNGVRLMVLPSPYRLLLEPLLDYIKAVAAQQQANETITIVVPQFVPRRWWHQLLHAQTAVMLRLALLFHPGIVITSVPYQMTADDESGKDD